MPTVLDSLTAALSPLGIRLTYNPGVNTTNIAAKNANDTRLIAAAVAAARAADRIVLVLGNSLAVESEAADRIPDRFGERRCCRFLK